MGAEKTPAETLAETLAELERQVEDKKTAIKGSDPETQSKIDSAKADIEYLGLVEKFNALGKQGQKYAIVDVTSHGKGFVVLVTSPKAEIHKKTITHLVKEDKLTDAKVLEIVRDYVKHPALDVFDAMIAETPTVTDVCFAAISDLWGARARIRLEK